MCQSPTTHPRPRPSTFDRPFCFVSVACLIIPPCAFVLSIHGLVPHASYRILPHSTAGAVVCCCPLPRMYPLSPLLLLFLFRVDGYTSPLCCCCYCCASRSFLVAYDLASSHSPLSWSFASHQPRTRWGRARSRPTRQTRITVSHTDVVPRSVRALLFAFGVRNSRPFVRREAIGADRHRYGAPMVRCPRCAIPPRSCPSRSTPACAP